MIVVVGHGRSPEGKGWGRRIDQHPVVRMWNWHWQPVEDYGERYDYGLFVITAKNMRIFYDNNKRTPAVKWLAYIGKPGYGSLPMGPPIDIIDVAPWVKRAQDLGGVGLNGTLTLTRGCIAAAWALTHFLDVMLVGFDNLYQRTNLPIDEAFCPTYWRDFNQQFAVKVDKSYPTGQPKTATHDMAVERPMLEQLAKERSASLRFAQDCW